MTQVLAFINKMIDSNKLSKQKNQSESKDKYLTIEEAIKRYEELSSL